MNDIQTLCELVRQTAYDIHVFHAHGHLEKVYEMLWRTGSRKPA